MLERLRRSLKSRKPSGQATQGQVVRGASDQMQGDSQSQEISGNSTLHTFAVETPADIEDRVSGLGQPQSHIPPKQAIAGGCQFQYARAPRVHEDLLSSSATETPPGISIRPSRQGDGEDAIEMESEEMSVLSDTIDSSLITLWLKSCEQNHGVECSRRELESESLVDLGIILIDTRRKCLTRATTAARYLALSYVWGAVAQLQNTTALCERLMIPNALFAHKDAIPQVILDAIEVVNSLGEDHLWVDSLCIIQDDAAAKHHQISHMANIYSSAILTLVAVGARDANSNLPGVRPGTRWPRIWRQKRNELNRPLRPDLVLKAIDRTLYVSRAWTFQERHLSRRCLYFLDEQVYFQCRTELWCEEPSPLSPYTLLPLDLGLSIMSRAPAWAEEIRRQEWDHAFAFYAEIIQEYSWKSLSYPEDVINAFSGMVTALETHSNWNITHGLPEQVIDWALLWIPANVHERRPPPQSGVLLHFPSWSWIGWIGPVTFNLAFDSKLVRLRCILKDLEVEDFSQTPTGFRRSRRILFDKHPVGRVGHNDGRPLDDNFDCVHVNPPTFNKDFFVSGSTLRFSAMTIGAAAFEAKEMPPWQWDSEVYFDKRVRGDQNGIFLMSSTGMAGIFPGLSMEFLRRFQWSHLKLVAISEGGRRELIATPARLHPSQVAESELWNSYGSWEYNSNKSQINDWKVYYVMLVQRRGPYSERVAVGQVDKQSWHKANPAKETILLV